MDIQYSSHVYLFVKKISSIIKNIFFFLGGGLKLSYLIKNEEHQPCTEADSRCQS